MLKYILKRILTMIPMLIGISIMCYFIIDLAPGDASDMYFNPEIMAAHPEYMEQVREQLGLDKPVYVQYVRWLNELVEFRVFLLQQATCLDRTESAYRHNGADRFAQHLP